MNNLVVLLLRWEERRDAGVVSFAADQVIRDLEACLNYTEKRTLKEARKKQELRREEGEEE